jgi:hypothetical protein
MPESNEPQDRPEGGKTPYRPAPAEVEEIPLADDEPPARPMVDLVAPEAPPPEPPEEPIDEGAITLD